MAGTPPEPEQLVARLVELIDLDGRTDREIAAAAGFSNPTMIHRLRAGLRADPHISTFARVLTALNRRFADLDPTPIPEE